MYNNNLPLGSAMSSPKPYWNSEAQNAHTYNSASTSQLQRPPDLNSTPVVSPIRPSHANSNYGSNGCQSPQGWSSPNMMHTSRTPSPSLHRRTPCHVSQFSPPTSMASPMTGQMKSGINAQIHSSSQSSNNTHPLQSLEKMVMVEAETPDLTRNEYNPELATAPASASQNYFHSNDQLANSEPGSPYPTYFNLDQNRLCTPPQQTHSPYKPNSLSEYGKPDEGLKNVNKISNCDFGVHDSESCKNVKSAEKVFLNQNQDGSQSDSTGENPSFHKADNCDGTKVSCEATSLSSKGDNFPTSEKRVLDQNINPNSAVPGNCDVDSNNSTWTMKSYNALPQPPELSPMNSSIPFQAMQSDHRLPPPSLVPAPVSNPVSLNDSWTSSNSPSTSFHCHNPSNPKELSPKKKRGRPFGSKNKRRKENEQEGSIQTNENTSTSSVSSVKKSKKIITTEEIGVNTVLSVNVNSCDEIGIVRKPILPTFPTLSTKKKKSTGPVIRIENTSDKATVYTIINTIKQEDEKDSKGKLLTRKPTSVLARRPSLIGASKKKIVSTLAPTYDLVTRDQSWKCCLCHNGSHHKELGDLYGPYFLNVEEKVPSTQPKYNSIDEAINSVIANEISMCNTKKTKAIEKRRKSDSEIKKSKPKVSSPSTDSKGAEHDSHTSTSANQQEVWFHEDCAVWSSGVYVVGHRVRNLEEIVKESSEHVSFLYSLKRLQFQFFYSSVQGASYQVLL